MSRVEISVRDYASENPHVDYKTIVKRFGTPQQIASSYVDELETEELIRDLRIQRKIVWIVAIVAAMVVALWLGVVSIALRNYHNTVNGHIGVAITEESIIVIE